MNSLVDVRQGSQRPRLKHLPSLRAGSAGPDAVEWAAEAGLVMDEWQAWVLLEALAERVDERWSAFEVCLICPRQNGKGSVLEALELYHLFVLHTPLIVHSAHEFKTAREHFMRIRRLIEDTPELFEQVDYIHVGNNDQSIRLKDGCRLNFLARSSGSGRGFSGDLVVLDEAYDLPEAAIGAMGPTLSARPNPQIWYTSSAPRADSHVLHKVRNRGISQTGDRLFFAEWGNESGSEDNEENRARANPGYPHRLTPENLEAEADMMSGLGTEYARERLGIPDIEDSTSGVFGPGVWPALKDEGSQIDGPGIIALDVSPNFEFASFAAAGTRSDGRTHEELVDRRPGTAWVVARAQTLCERYGPLIVDPRGPVSGLLDDLKSAGVELVELADGDFPKACAALQKDVLDGTFRHLGQAPLDAAVAGAQIRPSGDAWRWSRSSSYVDISPLVAVTVAFWKAAKPRRGPARFHSFV